MVMVVPKLEDRLIESTQPIRYFTLAVSIYHLFDTGLFDVLVETGSASVGELANRLELDEEKLEGFLKYAKNEQIVIEENGRFRLSPKGAELGDFRGWYTMMIGGYAETFLQVGGKLKANSGWASRDSMKVGVGSCGISHYDAIPLTQSLMSRIPGGCHRLLDLGCGNGLYLVEFCKLYPDIQAWGVEPSEGGYAEAVKLVEEYGLQNRIRLTCSPAIEFFEGDFDYEPDFIVLGFVLHEILGQDGEEGVIRFLTQITDRFPEIHIIIIEVDNRIDDPDMMNHGLAKAYYNPYYLLHYFTRQRLETEKYWDNLFARLNLTVKAKETVNHHVDSTDLTIGYLLQRGK
ncbi:2-ketoarginine methyltransferase [Paenibacillus tyrfis]|uniref:2-ketoarginine methyltransferase n=1 Tax=Paenibacillus tyrfis TaxID=1501230 RepID=UPI0024932833|nr:2-ketoarginine methyltransferase [Paenibacillus tyrfis]GLI09115.1 2-ketoarginine methyltransferase [Paenibacillus tyrfis]